jgi:GNAT superfamily N-acetyltransferase
VVGRWLVGSDCCARYYQVLALTPVNGRPLIVGWLHGRFEAERFGVEEMFVWPHYRRRGIGHTLLGQGILMPCSVGAQTLCINYLDADAHSGSQRISEYLGNDWIELEQSGVKEQTVELDMYEVIERWGRDPSSRTRLEYIELDQDGRWFDVVGPRDGSDLRTGLLLRTGPDVP